MNTLSPSSEPVPAEVLARFLARERVARKEAEHLLEERSLQLYRSNVALEKEVRRTKAVFETAAEGIIIFDSLGAIESLNPAAMHIFGIAQGESSGLNVCDLVPSASFCNEQPPCDLKQRLKSLTGTNNELVGVRKDGSSIPLEFVVSEFYHNHEINFSGIVRDLSRRKALEAQLNHAQKMESVGQLAAGIAHELNTPIQFVGDNTRFLKSSFQSIQEILDQVQSLLKTCEAVAELSSKVAAVRQACDRADLPFLTEEIPLAIDQTLEGADTVARIVRAMKAFSHPGSDDFQEIDLNAALESTLTISRSEWKYCAEVETNYHPQLPPIHCLPGELNQVFLNLIVNAAHAMADKSQELGRLKVSTSIDRERAIVEISDTGTGIPKAIQGRIFDPFFTTKGVGKGTGQGLSICYNIVVEIHRGRLTFESIEGMGTTFRVELPLDPRITQAQ